MPTQLTFDLTALKSLDRGDYFVSASNKMAVRLIEDWQHWPAKKNVLSGPKSSGKTHLADIWTTMSGARKVNATKLISPEEMSQTHLLVEDVHEIAGDNALEIDLLHTHNLLHQKGFSLLMTGLDSPHRWNIALPDLSSRIEGAQQITLNAPDDHLFSAILAKQFADRQLYPSPEVFRYVILRLERSHEAARRFVERADQLALAEQRAITRGFAKYVLKELSSESD